MKGFASKRARQGWLVVPLALTAGFALFVWQLLPRTDSTRLINGIVWQPDNATVDITGTWEQIGARRLIVQWTEVDGLAFAPNTGSPQALQLPDWERISREPWAKEVILGLAGRFSETEARAQMTELVVRSRQLSKLRTPLNVVGWYFPVEVDPTWGEAPRMGSLLAQLPRPLWISVYDSANVGADVLANWLLTWLPTDIGVFFQDGVGVHARDALTARQYADVLSRKLGADRFGIIVEAFRPNANGGFRAATAAELAPQIAAYDGHKLYLFDGPHYVSDDLVRQLKRHR